MIPNGPGCYGPHRRVPRPRGACRPGPGAAAFFLEAYGWHDGERPAGVVHPIMRPVMPSANIGVSAAIAASRPSGMPGLSWMQPGATMVLKAVRRLPVTSRC
jgi:hypothetical protein